MHALHKHFLPKNPIVYKPEMQFYILVILESKKQITEQPCACLPTTSFAPFPP